jgi:DNA modification methylase
MTANYYVGDVFDTLRALPDDSVDLVLTSPPFLALRSYLPADHPDKAKEIGQEPTPAEFLQTLLELTAEWDRVLTPHGSIAVELGDSYSGSSGEGSDTRGNTIVTRGAADGDSKPKVGRGWPLAKSLCGIPTLYAWSLAYGRNLLTGEESPAGMWRIRNVIAWCRPNPPVGALGDKFRPATSYMTVATKAQQRWFDLDAVRTAPVVPHEKRVRFTNANTGSRADDGQMTYNVGNPAGAPPLDYWEIPTQPYKGAHYAAWPPALCLRPIEAMCPREVCRTCGTPRTRIVEMSPEYAQFRASRLQMVDDGESSDFDIGVGRTTGFTNKGTLMNAEYVTVGWSDCGHDNYRPGIVLDPFAGSGTTLAVATGCGRDAIGIDLDPRNLDLARARVGMFLTEATIDDEEHA